MRSTPGRPAPRSRRVGKVSASSFTPLCAAICAAASRLRSRSARPPSSSATLPPERTAWATACTAASSATGGCGMGGTTAGAPPSPQDTSAGRISVATCPGRPRAATMASAASRLSAPVVWEVRTKPGDTLRATVSMSDCKLGVKLGVVGGVVTHDVHHRHLALAGVVQVGQAIAQAAAQVQERGGGLVGHAGIAVGGTGGHAFKQGQHRAHRGSLSSAATKCISLVPGLVKQTSTPASTRVFIRACAPFMGLSWYSC
jgi:hypothetical protein